MHKFVSHNITHFNTNILGGFVFTWVTDNIRAPTYEDLPTEPYITCNWGDGTSTIDELFIMNSGNNVAGNTVLDRHYNFEHD